MNQDRRETGSGIIVRDFSHILKSFNPVNRGARSAVSPGGDGTKSIMPPELAEISLTYRCQNKCGYCRSSDPFRSKEFREMSTAQVKQVIDRIYGEAGISAISFTGGEPSLLKDLPDLIEYASKKGIKTNLVTNGIKCSDNEFVKKLAGSGLNSVRTGLESHDELIHNRITGNIESYKKTLSGIHNLKYSGIETRTNTTICRENRNHLLPLVKFLKEEFGADSFSMDMITTSVIPGYDENQSICYSSVPEILRPVLEYSEKNGIMLMWLSPIPFCIFNPAEDKLEVLSCACVSDILAISPAGEVLSSSYCGSVIGNLLHDTFMNIWNGSKAQFYREKRDLPPVCKNCNYRIFCSGISPIFWKNTGLLMEIEKINRKRPIVVNVLRSINLFTF